MTEHFPVGTRYRVVEFEDCTYGVEVTKPGAAPYSVYTFQTEGEASNWVAEQRGRTRNATTIKRWKRAQD